MKTIVKFLPGDSVPNDATLLTTSQYVDFKAKRRHIEFFFLVPKHSRKKK